LDVRVRQRNRNRLNTPLTSNKRRYARNKQAESRTKRLELENDVHELSVANAELANVLAQLRQEAASLHGEPDVGGGMGLFASNATSVSVTSL